MGRHHITPLGAAIALLLALAAGVSAGPTGDSLATVVQGRIDGERAAGSRITLCWSMFPGTVKEDALYPPLTAFRDSLPGYNAACTIAFVTKTYDTRYRSAMRNSLLMIGIWIVILARAAAG